MEDVSGCFIEILFVLVAIDEVFDKEFWNFYYEVVVLEGLGLFEEVFEIGKGGAIGDEQLRTVDLGLMGKVGLPVFFSFSLISLGLALTFRV
jgi:hypothetical protein